MPTSAASSGEEPEIRVTRNVSVPLAGRRPGLELDRYLVVVNVNPGPIHEHNKKQDDSSSAVNAGDRITKVNGFPVFTRGEFDVACRRCPDKFEATLSRVHDHPQLPATKPFLAPRQASGSGVPMHWAADGPQAPLCSPTGVGFVYEIQPETSMHHFGEYDASGTLHWNRVQPAGISTFTHVVTFECDGDHVLCYLDGKSGSLNFGRYSKAGKFEWVKKDAAPLPLLPATHFEAFKQVAAGERETTWLYAHDQKSGSDVFGVYIEDGLVEWSAPIKRASAMGFASHVGIVATYRHTLVFHHSSAHGQTTLGKYDGRGGIKWLHEIRSPAGTTHFAAFDHQDKLILLHHDARSGAHQFGSCDDNGIVQWYEPQSPPKGGKGEPKQLKVFQHLGDTIIAVVHTNRICFGLYTTDGAINWLGYCEEDRSAGVGCLAAFQREPGLANLVLKPITMINPSGRILIPGTRVKVTGSAYGHKRYVDCEGVVQEDNGGSAPFTVVFEGGGVGKFKQGELEKLPRKTPEVGACVKVTCSMYGYGQHVGSPGTIVEDDGGMCPFRVEFSDGRFGWFREVECETQGVLTTQSSSSCTPRTAKIIAETQGVSVNEGSVGAAPQPWFSCAGATATPQPSQSAGFAPQPAPNSWGVVVVQGLGQYTAGQMLLRLLKLSPPAPGPSLGVCSYRDGSSYEGQVLDEKRHGNGTLKMLSGEGYDGQWAHNLMHGTGRFTYMNGDVYEGTFIRGLLQGEGTMTYARGGSFQGQFKDGKRHGEGVFNAKDGATYTGQWVSDVQHGEGKTALASKDVYQGQWQNGYMHGTGTYTFARGEVVTGTWNQGVVAKR